MNIIAINRVLEDGERNIGVALEYDAFLDADTVDVDCFTVEGRTIVGAYVQNSPRISRGGSAKEGRYLILELSSAQRGAAVISVDPVTHSFQRKIPDYRILQCRDMRYCSGVICEAWKNPLKPNTVVNEAADGFHSNVYLDNETGITMGFRLFIPNQYEQGKEFPLLVFFHGGGEKGNDNCHHILASQGASIWAEPEEQAVRPCFILAPQCPEDGDWIDPDTYEPGACFYTACNILFSVLRSYSIDTDRIYTTGLSMGGMCAWEINKKYPHMFAASIQCVGQTNYEGIEVLRDKPIWIFHGQNDDKAMSGSVDIVETLEASGGKIAAGYWDGSARGKEAERMAEEQIAQGCNLMHTQFKEGTLQGGWVHVEGWKPVYSNRRVREWLFRQVNPLYEPKEQNDREPAIQAPVRLNLGFDGTQLVQLAPGNRHTLALLKDGSVYGWGFNCCGQVSGREAVYVDKPVRIKPLSGVKKVAAGNNFSIALLQDGTLYGWGANTCGQLAMEDTTARIVTPVRIKGIDKVKDISVGDGYAAAVREDGTVYLWGSNCSGQLADGTYFMSSHPVKVKFPAADGQPADENIIAVEAGVRTVMVRTSKGGTYCWGDGEYGQLGNGAQGHGPGKTEPVPVKDTDEPGGRMTGVIEMAAGRCFTVILKADGSLYNWGLNRHGELGRGMISETEPVPQKMETINGVTAVKAGMNHTVALKEDGTVWTWGFNKLMGSGVLGVDEVPFSSFPVRIKQLRDITAVYTGFNHNFAVRKDGSVWGWGNQSDGRIGPVDTGAIQ